MTRDKTRCPLCPELIGSKHVVVYKECGECKARFCEHQPNAWKVHQEWRERHGCCPKPETWRYLHVKEARYKRGERK